MVLPLLHLNDGAAGAERRELRGQAVQAVGEDEACLKGADIRGACRAFMLGIVALPDAVAGREDAVGKVSVVRQQEQALGILVEPADRHDAELPVCLRDEVHDGLRFRVVRGGEIARGLMEQDKDRPAQTHGAAVDRHADGGLVKFPALVGHGCAVDRHTSGADHRAQLLPAGEAGFT